MFVCCCASLCVLISWVYTRCGHAYRRILLTHCLNNKKYCAIDFRPGFSWSMGTVYFSCLKIAMRTSTPMSAQNGRKCICYLNNVAQDVKMISASGWTSKKHFALRRVYNRAHNVVVWLTFLMSLTSKSSCNLNKPYWHLPMRSCIQMHLDNFFCNSEHRANNYCSQLLYIHGCFYRFMRLVLMICMFLHEFVLFGMTWKFGSVWSQS